MIQICLGLGKLNFKSFVWCNADSGTQLIASKINDILLYMTCEYIYHNTIYVNIRV